MSETAQPELTTRYTPSEIEAGVYDAWQTAGLLTPAEKGSDKPTFTIMIPPPNVTGVLHMGHALNNTLQDVIARHKRMSGFDTLWVPGTDHAGIATQAVVEKRLFQEKGLTRESMGREAFLSEIWSWKEHHGNVILGQLRRLGASCDWTRTKFTLDDDMSTAVREAFVSLYERGLVYRGARLVNWDCKLQTAISDDEIEYKQQKGHMWYLRYPVKDSGQFVTVGTTRPETMLADTGVAVHPDDARYADLIGKTLLLPIVNREIPIVADESVERELGTGAVKVTPGHDPADYERGRRNNLPILNLLEKDGKLTDVGGPFAGLTKEAARKAVIEWFEANELLDHIEDITHNISISDRSKTPIEPLVSEQWFVKMQPLAEPAIEAVHDGSLEFKQARWKKVYLDWLENVHDWCISRQLWWGHRIPVWYDEDDTPFPSRVDVEIGSLHPDTGKPIVRQDPDVLDTWASSWLWPFATLGWPNEEATDLNRFYPTQFLSTARDIIYLWVARMVMAGYAFRKELPIQERCPFSTCYIHATVLDGKGRRMSKSAGNGIDPVEMIEKYGADAVRYSLMILTREGQDVKLAANRFELGQRFCNKIWNVSRFALGHLEGDIAEDCGDALEDRWIQARLDSVTAEVTTALGQYDFHDAAQALYRFTWDDFCDWYVESAKRRLRLAEDAGLDSAEAADAARVRRTLGNTLAQLLKLLHPFTPFLTERLWEHLPSTFRSVEGMLMGAEWPVVQDKCETPAEVDYAALQDAVRGFRNVRALLEIAASDKPVGTILANDEAMAQSMRANGDLLSYLAGLSELQVQTGGQRPADSGTDLFVGGSVFLPFTAETDASKLRDSLEKKALKISKGIQAIDGKLANERFIQNAGDDVVESERQRRVELEIEHSTLKANLSALS